MESFVAENPFPSYEEMLKRIEQYPDPALSIAMWSEYGRAHHAALKEVYESAMNPAIIRKAGETIDSLGGMRAMQMNFYAFAHCSPFSKSDDEEFQYAYKDLEWGWDGVGDWVA